MKAPTISLAAMSARVLAEVEAEERIKTAEAEALRAATPRHASELARVLHKLAGDLRAHASEVTYEDVQAFVEGRL